MWVKQSTQAREKENICDVLKMDLKESCMLQSENTEKRISYSK